MRIMCIMNYLGLFIGVIYFFNNFIKMIKNDEAEYQTVSLLALVDSIWFILSLSGFPSHNNKINFMVMILTTAIGYVMLVDVIFFATKRVKKNSEIYYAIALLEKAGISPDAFTELSHDEQLRLLKNTPRNTGRMLIEDEDDLQIFSCIMKKEKTVGR